MILFIIFAGINVFFWVMTVFMLRGVDWILVSGPNFMPKEDRLKFRETHDIPAMNRYAGKRICLPVSIWGLVATPLVFVRTVLDTEWTEPPLLYVTLITLSTVAVLVSVFSALPKILGDSFKK